MLQIIRKYPVISYLFLTYLISFVFWFLPVITIVRKEYTYFFFLLGMFGPMIAGYLMMLIQAGERIRIGSKNIFFSILILSFIVIVLRIFFSDESLGIFYIRYQPYENGLMPAFENIPVLGWVFLLFTALIPALGFSQINNTRIRENFFRSLRFEKGKFKWYLFGLLFFPLLYLFSSFIGNLLNMEISESVGNTIPFYLVIIPFLATLFWTGGNEEFGWRGFMQKELQKITNPLYTSLIIAFFWSLWHLPLYYNGIYSTEGFMEILPRFIMGIPVTIIFTWLYNKSNYSLLAVIIMHTALNNSWFLFDSSPLILSVIAVLLTVFFIFNNRMWRKKDYTMHYNRLV